jgi:hypothetical protein
VGVVDIGILDAGFPVVTVVSALGVEQLLAASHVAML